MLGLRGPEHERTVTIFMVMSGIGYSNVWAARGCVNMGHESEAHTASYGGMYRNVPECTDEEN